MLASVRHRRSAQQRAISVGSQSKRQAYSPSGQHKVSDAGGSLPGPVWDLLTLAALWTCLYLAPYTKVEESFNLQAIHDLLVYGPFNVSPFDHLQFPGVVPRTFIGPLVLSLLSRPFNLLLPILDHKFAYQYIVRGFLGAAVACSLSCVRRAVDREFGRKAASWFALLNVLGFNLMFWGTRTLPNVFAFVLVNFAFANWIGTPRIKANNGRLEAHSFRLLALVAFVSIVFRCDVAPLAGFILLSEVLSGTMPFLPALKAGVGISLLSISMTTAIDSYFWRLPFYWPELEVLIFNTVKGGSAAYGVSPFYTYFLSMIPKLAPLGLPLSLYAALVDRRTRRYLVPILLFVFTYSILPHKEWRFIIYVIPILNAVSGVAISHLYSIRQESRAAKFAILAVKLIAVLHLAFSVGKLYVSIYNYSGGEALSIVHNHLSSSSHKTPYIHIDTAAAMTGASLFGQLSSSYRYSKVENHTTPESFLDAKYTHLLTSIPEMHSSKEWRSLEIVEGFDGLSLYPGGIRQWVIEVCHRLGDWTLEWHPRKGVLGLPLPVRLRLSPKIWILERMMDANDS